MPRRERSRSTPETALRGPGDTLAPASIAQFGGKYLIRGGRSECLEGTWEPRRLVVLEFPSPDHARAWWESPEYAPAKALRQASAQTEMVLMDGAAAPAG